MKLSLLEVWGDTEENHLAIIEDYLYRIPEFIKEKDYMNARMYAHALAEILDHLYKIKKTQG